MHKNYNELWNKPKREQLVTCFYGTENIPYFWTKLTNEDCFLQRKRY